MAQEAAMTEAWVEKQVSRYGQNFDEADADKSGSLSFREISFSLVKGGYTGSFNDSRTLFKTLDTDGDKTVSRDEYLAKMKVLPQQELKEMSMRREFKLIDTNGTGILIRKEIIDAICNAELDPDSENIANLLKRLESDADKQLNYEEFLQTWRKQFHEH